MKLVLMILIMSSSAFASGFQSHYEDFAYRSSSIVKFETKTKVKRMGPRRTKRVKALSMIVNGGVASCGALRFRELFPKFKIKVHSCDPYQIDLSIKYLRVSACDMEMDKSGTRLSVELPKDCAFNSDTGSVNLIVD